MSTPDLPSDDTIAQLMKTDPLKLTDQNIDTIITALRGQRKNFIAGNKSAGTPVAKKSAATKKQEAALKATGDFNLDDLGL